MDKGKDVIEGGAVINSSGIAIIGLADTADSLSALQRVVFEEKALPLAGLPRRAPARLRGRRGAAAEGHQPGQDAEVGQRGRHRRRQRGVAHPPARQRIRAPGELPRRSLPVGYWTMTNHAGYGRLTGALPNGRKAHQNLTSGFTPVSGVTPYLTPALNSVAAMPARCLSSGVAFNLKFTPEAPPDDVEMLDNFAAAVAGYFQAKDDTPGGMEIQFNVTRREDFLDAMEHLEKYPQLLVRGVRLHGVLQGPQPTDATRNPRAYRVRAVHRRGNPARNVEPPSRARPLGHSGCGTRRSRRSHSCSASSRETDGEAAVAPVRRAGPHNRHRRVPGAAAPLHGPRLPPVPLLPDEPPEKLLR